MVSILQRQAERLGVLDASRASLERFRTPDAMVVVAGQQPGLFGGPLYTLTKALSAIALARAAEAASGRPVVPIFWVASDDHDFEEVRRTWLSDGGTEPHAIEYPLDDAPAGTSFSRIRLRASIGALLERVESLLPESEFRASTLELLREAYVPGRCWTEAFARFMAGFVAPLGALVFDPADPEAKALALPVFEQEIALAGKSSVAARERGEALVARGYHAQILRAGNELNLFLHRERREPIRVGEDGLFHLAGGQTMRPAELLAAIRERPEDASAGVLLRPMMQDHLLPTAAYVGGPAEVAYWAQVYALYPLFEMTPPAIAPRAGATILEHKAAKTLQRFGIEWQTMAGDVEVVIADALRAFLPDDFPGAFARERDGWRESFGRLEEKVASFDPSLKMAVATAAGRLQHESEHLEKKLMSVWKRRHEESVLQIRRARGQLFPQGHLQERIYGPVGFTARYGPSFAPRLAEALGGPGEHALVSLGG